MKLSHAHLDIKQGEAEPHILKLNAVFHHIPSAIPSQLSVLAHLVCTQEMDNS